VDAYHYIAMEYVDGKDLRTLLSLGRSRGTPMPAELAIFIAARIANALDYAHRRLASDGSELNLVHRDVSPQNILISYEGDIKLCDFGIAKAATKISTTQSGALKGKLQYMSPEQAWGKRIDRRSDIFSLGVVLYEMLTGDVPFQAETQVGVAMKHVNEPMPDVQAKRPEVSAVVASVVDRATTKDSRDRYSTVAEMVRDLEQTLEVEAARRGGTSGEATSVLDSVPKARRRLGGRRRPWIGIVMGIIGIALIAAAVIFGGEHLDLGGNSSSSGRGNEIRLSSDAASEFDPEGDQRETGTERQAVDSNPTGTAWSSEHYDTPDFGGLKDGVGLAIDAGSSVTAKSMVIRALTPGYDAQIYQVGGSPPTELSGWGQPVATISDGGDSETVALPGRAAQSFLIWITKLPAAKDDPGRYQMEISDVRLLK
jgi:serine/threonine-protein kinase